MSGSLIDQAVPVQRKPSSKTIGKGIVKEVPTGDTVVVMGLAKAGQLPPEKTITFSGLRAPRIQRGRGRDEDEPFAFHAREYLRKKLVGKQVDFVINHTSKTGRGYGTVRYQAQDLGRDVLLNGYVKFDTDKARSNKDGQLYPEGQELADLQAQAEKAKMHVWSGIEEDAQRKLDYNPDTRALFRKHQFKPLPAIVDRVLEGSVLSLEIPDPTGVLNHKMITLNLAGVECPRVPLPYDYLVKRWQEDIKTKPDKPKPVEQPAPFGALEAKAFVEQRLLQRDVNVILQGVDFHGNLFGSIQYHKGNVSHKLLEKGLGKVQPWSAAITGDAQAMRACEADARQKARGLWSQAETQPHPEYFESYAAKVVKVNGADSFTIVRAGSDEETRVYLSSIRTARMAGGRQTGEEETALEARELVRRLVMRAKQVRVVRDYVREDARRGTKNNYVTIYVGKENIAESLLKKGLAVVVPHGPKEYRSPQYSALLLAQEQSQKAGLGVFSKDNQRRVDKKARRDFPPAVNAVKDLTQRRRRNNKKQEPAAEGDDEVKEPEAEAGASNTNFVNAGGLAEGLMTKFQKSKKVNAVVEYAFNSSKFKLLVPAENVLIAYALAGIRTDSTKNEDKSDNQFGLAALDYVQRFIHKDAKMFVEFKDMGDNFIGSLVVGARDLAEDLLSLGLAYINERSINRAKNGEKYKAVELTAKRAHVGRWHDWDEAAEAAAKAEAYAARMAARREANGEAAVDEEAISQDEFSGFKLNVTELTDAVSFFITKKDNPDIATVTEAMENFEAPEVAEDWVPAKQSVCAGLFQDGSWCRVKVQGKTQEGSYRVKYVDFGNADELAAENIRPLPEKISKIKPLARECVLAGLKSPAVTGDRFDEAFSRFNDMVWNNDNLEGKVHFRDENNRLHMTLKDGETSIGETLLGEGQVRILTRLDRGLRGSERSKFTQFVANTYKPLELKAQTEHLGQWEFGIVSSDDEEPEGRRDDGRPPKRKL